MSDEKKNPNVRVARSIKVKSFNEIQQELDNHMKTNADESLIDYDEEVEVASQKLLRLKEEQKDVLAETRAEIAEEKENWAKTRKDLVKEAQNAGYKDGFAEGKQESLEQYQTLLDKANQIIEAATADYHAKLEKSEYEIIDLVTMIAKKMIHQTVMKDQETFLPIVQDAIKEVKEQSRIEIYVHPDSYQMVLQQQEELQRLVHGETTLSIYVNDNLRTGACLIEHPLGQIDASIDTQLEELRTLWYEVAKESNS